jgi:Domain of unknown function (DUF4157)
VDASAKVTRPARQADKDAGSPGRGQAGGVQPDRSDAAVRRLRPSQVPYPGESSSLGGFQRRPAVRAELRPSRAGTNMQRFPTRPSTVPAQPIRDVLRGPGQPLPGPVKEEMEGRLGADLADVRVHTGATARASAAAVGARAYTTGDHVVIGEGGADKHTLAHELIHVIQQRRGPVAGTDHGGGMKISDPGDRDEKAADAAAAAVLRAPLADPNAAEARQHPGGGRELAVQHVADLHASVPVLAPGAPALNDTGLESRPLGVSGPPRPASPVRVQRRTPRQGEIPGLGTDPEVLKKLCKTVLRTYADLSPTAQSGIVDGLPVGPLTGMDPMADYVSELMKPGYDPAATATALTDLIGTMESASRGTGPDADEPSLVEYPGAAQTFVPWNTLLDTAEQQKAFKTLVAQVQTLIREAGNDDDAIKRVFGDKQLSQAKPYFKAAAKRLGELLNKGKIGADLSGEPTQMRFKGLTSTEQMLLGKDFFDNLKAGKTAECTHTLCHEAFHTASASIEDTGGYRDETEFEFREPAEKLRNAEHFVEVVAQAKWGKDPRTLKPHSTGDPGAAPGGAPELDDTGKAQKANTDQLRDAWVMATRIHGWVKNGQKIQQERAAHDNELASKTGLAWSWGSVKSVFTGPPQLWNNQKTRLTLYSRLFGLTIHKRIGMGSAYPIITDLDLALSEGVTRRLGEAYGRSINLLKTNAEWDNKYPNVPRPNLAGIQDSLLEKALGGVRVRKTLIRDKEMVRALALMYKGATLPDGFVLPKEVRP